MAQGQPMTLLLLVAATLGQKHYVEAGLSDFRHSYDCGVRGMQLVVFPRPGQTIRFKVLDEFGNRFEVNNCSICYHWVSSEPLEPVVLSADYKGCHVLQKDGRFHLKVFIQAVLPDGRLGTEQVVTLICPKPEPTRTLDPNLTRLTVSAPPAPQTRPRPPSAHQALPSTSFSEYSSTPPTPPSSPFPTPESEYPSMSQTHWGLLLKDQATTKPYHTGTHLPRKWCHVTSGHIPCMARNSSKEACWQAGCCYDDTREVPCYYGNTATIQCFRNGYFIVVLSQEMALAHKITLANIRLAYAPTHCRPIQKTSAFLVFQVPLTQCGTTTQVIGNQLIYENQLVSEIHVLKGQHASITRDSTFRLHIRCIFNAGDFLPIQAAIFPPRSPAPVAQSGPLRLQLRIAKDQTFSSYYREKDYPLVRLLQEPVHVEIRLLERTDPNLVLKLHQCWATPSPNPFDRPQWPILTDGCPFKGDSYRTQMVPLDKTEAFWSHYQRFTVATFTLLNASSEQALRGKVYFFCSASACHPSGLETCVTVCPETTRRRRSPSHHNITTKVLDIVSSPGAVGFEGPLRLQPPGSSRTSNPSPLLWGLFLLLAVTLVLGVGLFVGLSQASKKHWEGTRR
ncbi:zona pellucida sperm-binding protein 1 [Dipodomys spectabilis]|uniref:zona pellucida sperm-binding protein 1 n=1 Tax=Dipodomys spectabilis TaxID=105255 RepID=UPI001C5421AF|nr:zona pellucida sperm-binding protein 1 [Dipodomys spectabilis]